MRKHRIVYDSRMNAYRAQVWRIWRPFWCHIYPTAALTAEACEKNLRHLTVVKTIVPALVLLLLASCAGAQRPTYPPLVEYTPEEQTQAKTELDAVNLEQALTNYRVLLIVLQVDCDAGDKTACDRIPDNADAQIDAALGELKREMLGKMMGDYLTLRDRIRAVSGEDQ